MRIFFKTPLRRLATLVFAVASVALLTAFMVHVPPPPLNPPAPEEVFEMFDFADYPAPDVLPIPHGAAPPSVAPPEVPAPAEPVAARNAFNLKPYQIKGLRLTRLQLERGAPKRLERSAPRDQSFEGLRDILRDSEDPEILAFAPLIDQLESIVEHRPSSRGRSYTSAFVREMYPLARFIEKRSGIPASVILAQIMVESGWGTSNITILKNNLMGIGNATRPDDFVVRLDLGDFQRDIRVHCMLDTTAFRFENVADSVLYYVYVLLQSPDNAVHYEQLRTFLGDKISMRQREPEAYRQRIIELIAEGYHSNPEWYAAYLSDFVERLDSMLAE